MKIKSIMTLASVAFAMLGSWSASADVTQGDYGSSPIEPHFPWANTVDFVFKAQVTTTNNINRLQGALVANAQEALNKYEKGKLKTPSAYGTGTVFHTYTILPSDMGVMRTFRFPFDPAEYGFEIAQDNKIRGGISIYGITPSGEPYETVKSTGSYGFNKLIARTCRLDENGVFVCTNFLQMAETFYCSVTAWGLDESSTKAEVSYRKSGEAGDWTTVCSKAWASGTDESLKHTPFELKPILSAGVGDYDLKLTTENGTNLFTKVRIEPSVYGHIWKKGSGEAFSLQPWADQAVISCVLANVNTNNLPCAGETPSEDFCVYVAALSYNDILFDPPINLGFLTRDDVVSFTQFGEAYSALRGEGEVAIKKTVDITPIKNAVLSINNQYRRSCDVKVGLRICHRGDPEGEENYTQMNQSVFCDFRNQFPTPSDFEEFSINISPNFWGATTGTKSELTVSNLTSPSASEKLCDVFANASRVNLRNYKIAYFDNAANRDCWNELKMTDEDGTEHTFVFSLGTPPADDPTYGEDDLAAAPVIVSCDYGVTLDGTAQGPYWNIGVQLEIKSDVNKPFAQWVLMAGQRGALCLIRTSDLADFASTNNVWKYEGPRMDDGYPTATPEEEGGAFVVGPSAIIPDEVDTHKGVVIYSLATNSVPFVKAAIRKLEAPVGD